MPSLELGCGPQTKQADVGVDLMPGPAVDVVHDLDTFPWPLPDATYDYILCLNVLEHLQHIVRVMEEIHRIATDGAIVEIAVPTASSPDRFVDPTHVRGFSYRSFDYFVAGTRLARYQYSTARFAIAECEFVPQPGQTFGPLDALAARFANRFKHLYENRLSYIYPMQALHFKLRVIK